MFYKTLLLDCGYRPLKKIDYRRAICMSILEKVDVVESYDKYIGSPSVKIKIPCVVRLRNNINVKPMGVRYSRSNVYARDNKTCQYCGQKFHVRDLTLDHVVPKSFGGMTSWTNIVTCCSDCNTKKADRTPKEANMRLIRKPKYPTLKTYFESEAGSRYPEQWEKWLY